MGSLKKGYILFSMGGLFLWDIPAHAYIDPGTGTFLWQVVLSALLGSLFFARRIKTRLLHHLSHLRKHREGR